MRRLAFLLCLLTLLLSGCASDQRSQALTTTLNAYANAMRWGDFQSCLQFIDPAVRKDLTPSSLELARYSQYKVSGYDDTQGPVANGENQVQQLVQVNIVNVNTQAERTVMDRQVWRYDPEKKRWWLTTGLPDIHQ